MYTLNMPDLAKLTETNIAGTAMLVGLIGAGAGFPPALRRYRANLCRLVDKATIEYQLARAGVLAQIAESQRSPEQAAKFGQTIYFVGIVNPLGDSRVATLPLDTFPVSELAWSLDLM